jgi:hypothetical protein
MQSYSTILMLCYNTFLTAKGNEMSLKKFIALENRMLDFMGIATIDENSLTDEQKRDLMSSIESSLSPEALTQDGELRGPKLATKKKMLDAAYAEIKDICAKIA